MAEFEIELPGWEVEEGVEVALTVSGDYWLDPGNRRGAPDSWRPAAAELDVRRVENARGCPLPAEVVGRLCADSHFLRAVEDAIQKEGL